MSKKESKKDLLMEAMEFMDDSAPKRIHTRKIRKLHPMGFRVVVRVTKDPNVTEAGLYLPEGAKQSMMESLMAEVVEVASAFEDHSDEETNVSGIPLGAHVLIPKNAGTKVPWDEDLRIIETKDVLAVVDEISLI